MKKNLLLIFFSLITGLINAQIDTIGFPIITNYSPLTYKAHFQNWGATQDSYGIMYFANGDGLLIFDGANWQTIEFHDEESARDVAITKSGKIFVAGDNNLGYLTSDSTFNLKFISLLDSIPDRYQDFRTIWDLKTCGDTVYARSSDYIFVIANNKIKTYHTKQPSFSLYVNSKNEAYSCISGAWLKIKNDSLYYYPNNERIFSFVSRNDTVFAISIDNKIFNIKNNQLELYNQFTFIFGRTAISDLRLYLNKFLIYSTYNGIFILDFNGKLYLKLNKDVGINSTNVYSSFIDNINNLWVLTSNGLSYVELSSPIRMIDERANLEITHPSFFTFLHKKIYACSGHKTYQINRDNYGIYNPTNITTASGQSWEAINIGNELYISHNPNILRIDKNNNVKAYGPETNIWTIKKSPFYANDYIVGTNKGFYLYKYNGDSLKFQFKIKDFEKEARSLHFDIDNNLWVGISHEAIYKIKIDSSYKITNIKTYNENKGLSNTNSIVFFEWNDTILISTYKNLFFFDSKKDSICKFHLITDNFDIKGKRILQLIGIDNFNNFWFEYYNDNLDAEIFCFRKQGDKFIEVNKFAKRLLNFSLGFTQNYDSSHTVIGTSKGFAFINNKMDYQDTFLYRPIVSKIYYSTKDSLLYGGYILNPNGSFSREYTNKNKLEIEFKNNNLRFIYAAPFYVATEKTQYRVMLKNYDENWSSWTSETKKEYTNLPPGNYVFMVEAINIYGKKSQISEFNLYIKYPWYRTIYAYIFYVIILILFLIALVKFFTFRLKRRNDKLEELVNERTLQIQQKNSELEQQKEEILTQAEELQIVNQELEKLSTIVRETDNAVILTDKDGDFIWVNNAFTKIFGYTLQELVTKVSQNIISDQTDEETRKTVNKCLTEKVTVEYELKLKNKTNQEIWVHTTLTPILDEEGEITSLIAIDADITPMKMYEKQIKEQRDQITASIRYARAIQESILPAQKEIDTVFDNFIIFKPKDIVSGDFYWISNLFTQIDGRLTHVRDDNPSLKVGYSVFFAVVDCTGHGVPGAFMSLISSHLLGEIINEQRYSNTKEIMEQLDVYLSKALKRSSSKNYDGMVVSLCRFDKVINNNLIQTKVTFTGAKQHISYYKNSTKKLTKIRGAARQIGFVLNKNIQFKEHKFFLEKGDTIFMYTDGLKDLNNPERESFGHSQIRAILEKNIDNPINEIGETLKNKMNNWLGNDFQRDDITFLGLRIK
ncbi:MAG: PAS domain S-box protein [Bacteroidales bacterium]|nr:PAS domain S-box protein [Bacteroidales bacterium]